MNSFDLKIQIQYISMIFLIYFLKMIKYLPDLIILIKISFFLPQSEIDQFEPFNFKESICINYKDPQFPPFDTFIYEKHTDPTRLPLAFVGRDYKNDTAVVYINGDFKVEAANWLKYPIKNGRP